MANNVFGNPITDETLKGMPDCPQPITKRARAQVAMLFKNAENKDVNANHYVEGLKKQWGDKVSTLCLLYNATGDTVKFVGSHDWWGNLGSVPYPLEMANGQWGAFLHGKRAITPDGSNAAVVYRGKNENGHECDWMVAWDNPWNKMLYGNKVYTEIREVKHFDDKWDIIKNIMKGMAKTVLNHEDSWNGCQSSVSIGDDETSSFVEAVLTLAPDT